MTDEFVICLASVVDWELGGTRDDLNFSLIDANMRLFVVAVLSFEISLMDLLVSSQLICSIGFMVCFEWDLAVSVVCGKSFGLVGLTEGSSGMKPMSRKSFPSGRLDSRVLAKNISIASSRISNDKSCFFRVFPGTLAFLVNADFEALPLADVAFAVVFVPFVNAFPDRASGTLRDGGFRCCTSAAYFTCVLTRCDDKGCDDGMASSTRGGVQIWREASKERSSVANSSGSIIPLYYIHSCMYITFAN